MPYPKKVIDSPTDKLIILQGRLTIVNSLNCKFLVRIAIWINVKEAIISPNPCNLKRLVNISSLKNWLIMGDKKKIVR